MILSIDPIRWLRYGVGLMAALWVMAPGVAHAQRWREAWDLLKINQPDTARLVADLDVASEPGQSTAMSWYVRGMVYKTLYDQDDAAERYRGEQIDLTAFASYERAILLDATRELTPGILEDLLALTEDFAQTGLDLFERGYEARQTATLAQAALYLDHVDRGFALLAGRQATLYKTLQDFGIDRRTLELCRALAKYHSGQREQAAELYLKLVQAKTTEPTVYLTLREYYVNQGDKAKALDILTRGRALAPTSVELGLAYAEALADTNQVTKAMQLAQGYVRQRPDDPAPLATAGFIEERRGRLDQAETYYLRALERDGADFKANFRMAKLLVRRATENRRNKATALYIRELEQTAVKYAEAAAAADPGHPANTRVLYELYQSLGYADKAQALRASM